VFEKVKSLFSSSKREEMIQKHLDEIRAHLPVPVFWLFGKTQTGKTTLVKYLTGADEAEIGRGFLPCTRFSRKYNFPSQEAPLAVFLDTRGLDEPGYDPAEDLAQFNTEAHVVVVTVKATDHAQENVVKNLRTIRAAQPRRPVVLVVTCLHEAYPQQQHPLPYPFVGDDEVAPADPPVPEDLLRSIAEHKRRFEGLYDRVVCVDLTPPEEGFNDPEYGGPRLRQVLFETLPAAVGQTLLTLREASDTLQEIYLREAMPHIYAYSTMAATAGALPIPIVDVILLSGIQTRMVYHLAQLYGQPMTGKRFTEIAGSLGMGILVRQAGRGLIKLIPGVGTVIGSVAGGALAGASTYALGLAFCYYYQAVHKGHVPKPEDLKRYYKEQLNAAEHVWMRMMERTKKEEAKAAAEQPPAAPPPAPTA
jgi:uncharacterized protein (DUF697 family)